MANGEAADKNGQDDAEEVQSLLSASSTPSSPISPPTAFDSPSGPRAPRTAQRVRFQLDELPRNRHHDDDRTSDTVESPDWIEEEDFLSSSSANGHGRDHSGHRVPLLTDIEAPSVTLSTDLEFNAEDHLESARPKSGMRSAFMNMANSIM